MDITGDVIAPLDVKCSLHFGGHMSLLEEFVKWKVFLGVSLPEVTNPENISPRHSYKSTGGALDVDKTVFPFPCENGREPFPFPLTLAPFP